MIAIMLVPAIIPEGIGRWFQSEDGIPERAVEKLSGVHILATNEVKETAGAIWESRWRSENLLLAPGWGHADDQPEDHTHSDTTD
jgi:hypothetical protein